MSSLNTDGISEILDPGLRKIFFEVGKERPLEYPATFNVTDMDWNPMTDRNAAGLGTMPTKLEGQQFTLDQPIMGNTKVYTAVPYGMAFEASWEIWRDDMYGFLTVLASQLAVSARNRQEVQAWAQLNNGFSGGGAGFDTAQLISTSHVGLDGATRVNRPSPDIGISVTGVQQMIQDFESLTNDRGLPWLKAPNWVIVTPTNKFTAREVLGSSSKPFTANNEFNSLLEEDLGWTVSHYLTTGTNWFASSRGDHDVWFLWRDQPMFDSFDDPRTKTAVFTAYQRFAEGFGEWRGWWGSTG